MRTAVQYWDLIEATDPEIWPGSTPWRDHWGSFGTTPDAQGLGASVMRTRVPAARLPSFWQDTRERYPSMLPRFSVGPGDTPGLAEFLKIRGYEREIIESVMVMDRDRFAAFANASVPAVVEVSTPQDLHRVFELDHLVFRDPIPNSEGLAKEFRRLGTTRRLFLVPGPDGTALAAAGLTHFPNWTLLWGAETHPAFRHQGLYRALLTHRLRVIAQHGAGFAAVYANHETSMPILARCGFVRIGAKEIWKPPGAPSSRPI